MHGVTFVARVLAGIFVVAAAQAQPTATTRDPHAPVLPSPMLTELAKATHAHAKPPASVQATLSTPYGLALDSAGNLYVANIFGGVTIYSEGTHQLMGTITAGTSYPAAVSVSAMGNIYVANNAGDNITIYNPELQQIGTISDPTLYGPTGLYLDPGNTAWVLDATGTLHVYLDNGASAGSLAIGGSAVGPWAQNITVWGISDGAGGYNEDLQDQGEALHDGPTFLSGISQAPAAGGETQDASGQQYVTDTANNQVDIFSADRMFYRVAITTPAKPFGIAVDSAHKLIYVSLPAANEIIAYSTVGPWRKKFTIY